MTQPSGEPSSERRTADAAHCEKYPLDSTRKERSNMAELTPWQQALLYVNRANPYPFYAELRKTPVLRQEDGSYVVSTYREIVSLLHDPRVSSDRGKRPQAVSVPVNGGQAAESAYVHEQSMITMDPPEHDRVRRSAMRHFGPPSTPDLVANMEPEVRRIVTGVLDRLKSKKQFDAVDEFAYPLPVTVICEILGVPRQDEPLFHGWIQAVLNGFDLGPEAASDEHQRLREAGQQSMRDLNKYMEGLVDRCVKQPGPGMLSAMVNDTSDERLSKRELVSNATLLLFAGHETTVNLIAHSVLILLRNSAAFEKLRRRPELIVPGIEEFLRLESSVQFWPFRTALEDIEIAGTIIPKGSPIIVVYASGNRDPKRFTNPDEVNLERPDNEHLGFGGPLARLEAQIAVAEFVRRVMNPRLIADPPPYRRNQVFRGPRHLMLDIDGVRD